MAEIEIRVPSPRVHELGCGDARVLARIVRWRAEGKIAATWQLSGSDVSKKMLGLARKRCGDDASFSRIDIEEWNPQPEYLGNFDLVLGFFVLVHLGDPGDAASVAASMLRPGGICLVNAIPQKEPPVLENDGQRFTISSHVHTREEIASAFEAKKMRLLASEESQWSSIFTFVR